MTNILLKHRQIWQKKKILRIIYTDWYNQILSDLKKDNDPTVEIGAGSGNFKEFYPKVMATDVEKHSWLDLVFDAHKMPFRNGSIANLVMIDAFHHLHNPIKFLEESYRVLKKGGRILMVEPFPSPFSLLVYRRFHPEPFLMEIDYYHQKIIKAKHPWSSNQAIPYLIFFKNSERWQKWNQNKFKIIKKEKMSFLLYPLSGGFEHPPLIPDALIPCFRLFEKMLQPIKNYLAFRCYLVLEKK